jgi:hypothetical protein
MVVFHFASLVTGTLTFSAARYSRRPETRISRRPAGDAAAMVGVGCQKQQTGGHEQLVGDRVQHAADIGRLLPRAGEITVEVIGDAGGKENRQRRPAGEIARFELSLKIEAQNDQRHRQNAGIGQHVRQVESWAGHFYALVTGKSDRIDA